MNISFYYQILAKIDAKNFLEGPNSGQPSVDAR
jgi:hypothetical protein